MKLVLNECLCEKIIEKDYFLTNTNHRILFVAFSIINNYSEIDEILIGMDTYLFLIQ